MFRRALAPPGAPALASEVSIASRKMRTLFNAFVRERGLTLARARALLLLSRNPAMNQTALACALEIENPTVVRLLDGLEKQGLIVRAAVAGDRRANRIPPTDAAPDQVAPLEEISAPPTTILLGDIDPAAIAVGRGGLRPVVRHIPSASS